MKDENSRVYNWMNRFRDAPTRLRRQTPEEALTMTEAEQRYLNQNAAALDKCINKIREWGKAKNG